MKKRLALVLALIFLLTAPLTLASDPLTEGFDPEAVTEGTLRIMNAALSGKTSAVPDSKYSGNYEVLFNGESIGAYIYITRMDAQGNTSTEGVPNTISFSLFFPLTGNDEEIKSNIAYWMMFSASILQYLTDEENNEEIMKAVQAGLSEAMNAPDMTASFSYGGYEVQLVMLPVNNDSILFGIVIRAPGL